MLSYDEALFYKILAQTGYINDVNDWIDSICYSKEKLEGIFLDLVSCYGNLNDIISLLNNYIGDNLTNDIDVCNKLRLFLLDKLNSEKITIEEATTSLQNFAVSSGRMYEEGWSDFYYLCDSYDYILEEDMGKVEYYAIMRQFIETGKNPEALNFWNKQPETNSKKEKKYKIITGIVLTLYSFIILLITLFVIKYIISNDTKVMDIILPAAIIISCLFIVPPVVFASVGWDMLYSFLTRENKQKRRKVKEERKKLEESLKQVSDDIRKQYDLPRDMMTSFEYGTRFKMKWRWKWILLGVCEFICLCMTIGSAFYFRFVSPPVGVSIILCGLMIGIYGFCIICDAYIKGLLYSFLPVLCYVIPLGILYYAFRIHTEWMLGLFTIISGSILFTLFMIFVVVFPTKKAKTAQKLYYTEELKKYPSMHDIRDYIECELHISLWKKDGTDVTIFEYEKGQSSITLTGKIKYNNVLLKNQILYYEEVSEPFENCVKRGIELLKNYNANSSNAGKIPK